MFFQKRPVPGQMTHPHQFKPPDRAHGQDPFFHSQRSHSMANLVFPMSTQKSVNIKNIGGYFQSMFPAKSKPFGEMLKRSANDLKISSSTIQRNKGMFGETDQGIRQIKKSIRNLLRFKRSQDKHI